MQNMMNYNDVAEVKHVVHVNGFTSQPFKAL
jgi:hypothetical protein